MRDNRAIVEKAISETIATGVRVNYILSEDIPKQRPVQEHTTFMKSTLDMFDGRILKEE